MPASIPFRGKVRRVGNSLGFLIPADTARKAGIHEGDGIEGELRMTHVQALGLLKGVIPYEPFSREDLYDDD